MMHGRRAFTFAEMLVVISVMVVATALIVPRMGDTERMRLMGAARLMSSDIELAQVMTMSNPEQSIAVGFDQAADSYWLAVADSLDPTPLAHPATGDPYYVALGTGRAGTAVGVDITLENVKDNELVFDARGGLVDFDSEPRIKLALGTRWIRLDVSATTGTITETSGP